ncbi:putative aminopeptidase YsdC [Caprobacter fermentans]|uniref:M20/M25/M40 family metallo-hydrolase n=1 Tax=Caproicibacter fermentans TaxID=2576756 RepID=A0A6N8I078_9FIRM|nr:M20/M25/M40 family metallo-hydrolase [Caproicibacter fermentans]MVB11137.1 putative aminopeptidase YsdC [Caproicibacter fermentans]QNK39286.1 M20/M25/M40 family metallo-hydrolase [Caproicibacter fermentans]
MEELEQLIFRLCSAPGTPGGESPAAEAAAAELSGLAKVQTDRMGNLTAEFGNPDAREHVLLDAHLDQIGLIVTGIDENGFLKIGRCGGTDARVLPGGAVTVYGAETLCGVVCCTPPHLQEGGEDKVEPVDKMAVDVGLSHDEAEKLVRPGDRVLFRTNPKRLLGTRVSAAGLDNRAGVAVFCRCAQILKQEKLNCKVTVLFSAQEETGGAGAKTGAFAARPTQAIAVDVSFAKQPGVPDVNLGSLGGGPMIGIAPVLSRSMTDRLIGLAEEKKMPWTREIMGGGTGTNSDEIATTGSGVPTALISVPLRYMHTPAEVIDLKDIENTAQLIAAYLREVG